MPMATTGCEPKEVSAEPAVSAYRRIVLQHSQNAARPIFRGKTKQATICSLKPAIGIACEFGARRRSPPHNYSIIAPTARRNYVQCFAHPGGNATGIAVMTATLTL